MNNVVNQKDGVWTHGGCSVESPVQAGMCPWIPATSGRNSRSAYQSGQHCGGGLKTPPCCVSPGVRVWCPGAEPGPCTVESGLGTFGDQRSGDQHQTGTKTMGNLAAASHDRNLAFAYKYVVGYCRSGKGSGTGPKLSITVGGTEVWSRQLQMSSE